MRFAHTTPPTLPQNALDDALATEAETSATNESLAKHVDALALHDGEST